MKGFAKYVFIYQMYYNPLDELENDDALLFSKKIRKHLEKVQGRLYVVEKELSKSKEDDEHQKLWRRKNHLERFSDWLESCIQDLDDIHKGVPWKYPNKHSKTQADEWYEWKPLSERSKPAELTYLTPVKSKVSGEGQKLMIRQVSKKEALLSMGYSPEMVSMFGVEDRGKIFREYIFVGKYMNKLQPKT
ncbi:hypothetical protein GMAR_ORF292 [Golden Marseillevirus]|uniref:hypothetical protein n=1 Tax=Golden Marseillevirus TaxID=1720526 RepID=UPI000877A8C0|nr:hypothetical protein GMAR_ORF292 [Golden Marseillevirus]ALX27666.1 hypothetical protein GMAR_ORF292 [Golden Marseillevirus]